MVRRLTFWRFESRGRAYKNKPQKPLSSPTTNWQQVCSFVFVSLCFTAVGGKALAATNNNNNTAAIFLYFSSSLPCIPNQSYLRKCYQVLTCMPCRVSTASYHTIIHKERENEFFFWKRDSSSLIESDSRVPRFSHDPVRIKPTYSISIVTTTINQSIHPQSN